MRLRGNAEHALVLTADVIGPLVDDAETFGAIAAANSLSDIYAMGGRPLYALNLVFFPDEQLPLEILQDIMRGAAGACASVGVPIVGGHTVRNDDVKFGLAVTGEVALGSELSNRRASGGQHLVLTKALGTGIRGMRWRDIEVVRRRGQAPTIKLHGTALARAERLGISHLALSLSHSEEYAVAFVVGESREGNILDTRRRPSS